MATSETDNAKLLEQMLELMQTSGMDLSAAEAGGIASGGSGNAAIDRLAALLKPQETADEVRKSVHGWLYFDLVKCTLPLDAPRIGFHTFTYSHFCARMRIQTANAINDERVARKKEKWALRDFFVAQATKQRHEQVV